MFVTAVMTVVGLHVLAIPSPQRVAMANIDGAASHSTALIITQQIRAPQYRNIIKFIKYVFQLEAAMVQ